MAVWAWAGNATKTKMKKCTLLLSLCSLVGCALSSNAAVDINLGGTEYAITFVDGTYNGLAATLDTQPWWGNLSTATTAASEYLAAGGTDGTYLFADADNKIGSGKNAYYLVQSAETGGITLNTDPTATYEYAEATVVVPESATCGLVAASMVMVCAGARTLRKSRQQSAA
jgi:hypothetical protein